MHARLGFAGASPPCLRPGCAGSACALGFDDIIPLPEKVRVSRRLASIRGWGFWFETDYLVHTLKLLVGKLLGSFTSLLGISASQLRQKRIPFLNARWL